MKADDVKPAVGDPAPDLSLPTETGSPFALADVRGRPVLISFLSHAA